MATKTEKMPIWIYTHLKLCYVGKVPKNKKIKVLGTYPMGTNKST